MCLKKNRSNRYCYQHFRIYTTIVVELEKMDSSSAGLDKKKVLTLIFLLEMVLIRLIYISLSHSTVMAGTCSFDSTGPNLLAPSLAVIDYVLRPFNLEKLFIFVEAKLAYFNKVHSK